jgi:hypothetical protein
MLNTVRRFIYTKYWGIVNADHCGKIYLHKLLRNTLCWTLWEDLFTQNTEEYTVCWTLCEGLFTQNTEQYCTLNTVGRFIYTKYWGIRYVEHWEDLFTQNTEEYFMLNTVGRLIYPKYWGIPYVEHCGKIYLPKILRNTLCWALWEDLFTHNTGDYFMLSTVGRFIYTKYWGILYVEQCGKIYLHKIPRNTLCWALWEDLITQNTEEYCMLSTVGRFIYTKYRGILYVELWEDLFTQNTEEYFVEHCGKIYLHKILIILYVKHCDKIYLHKLLRNTSCWTLWEYLFT